MLGGLGLKAHDAEGFGFESPGQYQLMLMMLGGWGVKAQASTAHSGDARGFGLERPGQRQLMLMMLGGSGFKAPASTS